MTLISKARLLGNLVKWRARYSLQINFFLYIIQFVWNNIIKGSDMWTSSQSQVRKYYFIDFYKHL